MIEKQLPSGLYVAEEDKPDVELVTPAETSFLRCARCGLESTEKQIMVLGWSFPDRRFRVSWPTCGHDKYITCRHCPSGCPICGCSEEYT